MAEGRPHWRVWVFRGALTCWLLAGVGALLGLWYEPLMAVALVLGLVAGVLTAGLGTKVVMDRAGGE